jgi:hypothetical protein
MDAGWLEDDQRVIEGVAIWHVRARFNACVTFGVGVFRSCYGRSVADLVGRMKNFLCVRGVATSRLLAGAQGSEE